MKFALSNEHFYVIAGAVATALINHELTKKVLEIKKSQSPEMAKEYDEVIQLTTEKINEIYKVIEDLFVQQGMNFEEYRDLIKKEVDNYGSQEN